MDSEAITSRLLRGERIVWSGRPGQGLILVPRDLILIPFSLAWCGFAVFWTVEATSSGAPGFFDLWGGMFVCVGLYCVFGRFAFDAWIRRGIHYAVTDRRVLIVRSRPFPKFTAIAIDPRSDISLDERSHGRGTIRFGEKTSPWNNPGMGGWAPALDPTPQFIVIDDARRVFDLIQQSGHAG